MRIGKIENDFLENKMAIRELIDNTIPEEMNNLDELFKQIDLLVQKATNKIVNDYESK